MKDKRNTQQVLAQRYKDMVGKTYRHFKDVLVIYRSVSDPSLVWARPISMFLSDVDKYKYPLARQDRRFVEVEPDD